MNNSKYKYRWTSVHNGSCKYRLRSPEARSDTLIRFILSKRRGKITTGMLYKLGSSVSEKYHANDISISRYMNKFIGRFMASCGDLNPSPFARKIPYPIRVNNLPIIKDNSICDLSKIKKNSKSKIYTPRPKHDVIYMWCDSNSNIKIGITTTTSSGDRISGCAKNRGTEVLWRMMFKLERARDAESYLLTRFTERPYTSGDGYTEFRTLSVTEIRGAIDYIEEKGGVKIE